jgi:hypothetical protein
MSVRAHRDMMEYNRESRLDIKDLFNCHDFVAGKEYPVNFNKLIHAFPQGFQDWPVEVKVVFDDTTRTVELPYNRMIRADIYLRDKKIYIEDVEFDARDFKIFLITKSPVWIRNTFV